MRTNDSGCHKRRPYAARPTLERLEARHLLAAGPILTELLASNSGGLRDGDGQTSDWIEIYNQGDSPVDLFGYRLTDRATNLAKWVFPRVNLDPGRYLVVFASGREGAVDAQGELHANFSLRKSGEYLALVDPDGRIVSEFGAAGQNYPEQLTNVSYGVAQTIRLVHPDSLASYWQPQDDRFGTRWTQPDFEALTNGFSTGTASMGYEGRPTNRVNFVGQFLTELPAEAPAVYARIEFLLNDASAIRTLTLRLKYDNGFVAYLNGVKVAEANAPAAVNWMSTAVDSRRNDTQALAPVEFDLTAHRAALVSGKNVLALHGLNHAFDLSDMLLVAELTATASDMMAAVGVAPKTGFMPRPTPGGPNGSNAEVFSGFVADVQISAQRGFYDAPFPVQISTPTPGAQIRYTTDGSPPTSTDGSVYTGPITIDRTTTLRAAAFQSDHIPSRVNTQSYLFLDQVVNQPKEPAGFPSVWTNRLPADYEMSPNYPASDAELRAALEALPSLSIVMDLDDLFGVDGIYNQGEKRANSHLERPTSIEWLSIDSRPSFQIDAGIQPRSHPASTALKRGLQLEFKADYGSAKLEFPVFQDALADAPDLPRAYDKLILRSGFIENYTGRAYDHTGQIYIRDLMVRDAEIEMTGYGTRSVWVHVYLNGLYWGMYNLTERINDEWAAAVFGGRKEDWLVVKRATSSSALGEYESGDPARFQEMIAFLQRNNLALPENYRVATTYLDPVALADYMILQNFYGIGDWPTNNWTFIMRNGDDPLPGRFIVWDAEKALYPGSDRAAVNVPGFRSKDFEANMRAWLHPHLATTDAVPGRVWRAMLKSDEFRMLFADRVQKHLFHGGALSNEAVLARFDAHAAQVDDVLIADQARWSDDRRRDLDKGRTFTKSDWEKHVQFVRSFIDLEGETNVNVFVNAFRAARILPKIEAPVLSPHGGEVPSAFLLTITGPPDSAIWVTTDGSDPRVPGGTIHPAAVPYSEPIRLNADTVVKARAFNGQEWSALSEAAFTVHQEPRVPGDANGDGIFDSSDLVRLFQAGEYEDGVAGNSAFQEGDFNGDGDFTSADLTFVFQRGTYTRAAIAESALTELAIARTASPGVEANRAVPRQDPRADASRPLPVPLAPRPAPMPLVLVDRVFAQWEQAGVALPMRNGQAHWSRTVLSLPDDEPPCAGVLVA